MDEPRPTADLAAEPCAHRHIDALSAIGADGVPGVWACHDCKLRFYPACPTCVDVGHRNIEHPAAARPADGVTREQLMTVLHKADTMVDLGPGVTCPQCEPKVDAIWAILRAAARPADGEGLRAALRAVLRDFEAEPTEEYLTEAVRIFRAALADKGSREASQ